MGAPLTLEDRIVASLRRIMRAVDLHSRHLREECGLTGPQLATLQELQRQGASSAVELARAVHLSTPTMAGILARLERDGLVSRHRSTVDRRSLSVEATPEAGRVLAGSPSLLQDTFREQLGALAEWERHQLLSSLQRIAGMMDAEALDAAPHLATGPTLSPSTGATSTGEGAAAGS